ncbi:hypothetical protein RUND412_009864 [Rhizina undulata]
MSLASHSTKSYLRRETGRLRLYAACTKPLESLRKISLTELFEGSQNTTAVGNVRGRYLLVRTLDSAPAKSDPYAEAYGHLCEVEDEEGARCHLRLTIFKALADAAWPTYLVIKEPQHLQLSKEPLQNVELSTPHRSDWEVVLSVSPLIPEVFRVNDWKEKTRAELKEMGNELYRAKRWWAAIERYSQAMAQPEVDSVPTDMLLRNRAMAARCGELFDFALNDSKEAARLDPGNSKNLFQVARSYYVARDFETAREQLEILLAQDRRNAEGKALLNQCRKRLEESRTGVYPFSAMMKEIRANKKMFFDVGDYKGPVEVKATEEFGKGVYVTQNVKAGDLLMVYKALCFTYDRGNEVDETEATMLTGKRGHKELTELLSASKKLRGIFSNFYMHSQGIKLPVSEDIDMLHHEIIKLTVNSNSFRTSVFDFRKGVAENYGGGIWHLPSFINHSCLGNARPAFIGDLFVLRAVEDIPAGDQVFICYTNGESGYVERSAVLKEKFGFNCQCRRCIHEASQPPELLAKRESLVVQMTRLYKTHPPGWYEALETLTAEAEKTYVLPPPEDPRIQLAAAISNLFNPSGDPNNGHEKIITQCVRVLHVLGFVLDNEERVVQLGYSDVVTLSAMVHLYVLLNQTKQFRRARRWKDSAFYMMKIMLGYEDNTIFEN